MRRRANAVLAFAVALVVVIPLWPLTHAAFLNWDDDAIFLQNAPLTGASPRRVSASSRAVAL